MLLVGDADEQVLPERYAPLLERLGADLPVRLLPGLGHGDMIAAPVALEAVVATVAPPK